MAHTTTTDGALRRLAEAYRVSTTYSGFDGQEREVPEPTLRAVLDALGADAGDDAAIESLAVQLGLSPDIVRKQTEGLTYLSAQEQAEQYFDGTLGRVLADTAEFLVDAREIDTTAPAEVYQQMPYAEAIEEVAGR